MNTLPTNTTRPNPITYLRDPIFRPIGALPNGFPKALDLNKDTQAGKLPVKGQSRFSKIDVLCPKPLTYHDTTPLPPKDLLASLNPTPQILIYGDGLPYHGFLRSFSLADLPTLERKVYSVFSTVFLLLLLLVVAVGCPAAGFG